MSFSFSAASVENDYELSPSASSTNNNQPLINKRKLSNQHKRTQRNKPLPTYDSNQVQSAVEAAQTNYASASALPSGSALPSKEGYASMSDDDNLGDFKDDNLGDFKPLAPPMSAGQERMKNVAPHNPYMDDNANAHAHPNAHANPNKERENTKDPNQNVPYAYESNDTHDLDQNFMTDQQSKQYYRKLMGNYPNTTSVSQLPSAMNSNMNSSDPVMTKLNYLIGLMEEQQSEKTDSVMEDTVLYSFLGVFIIFIVDSFVRVGKYVR
jgi:hypothetical protein